MRCLISLYPNYKLLYAIMYSYLWTPVYLVLFNASLRLSRSIQSSLIRSQSLSFHLLLLPVSSWSFRLHFTAPREPTENHSIFSIGPYQIYFLQATFSIKRSYSMISFFLVLIILGSLFISCVGRSKTSRWVPELPGKLTSLYPGSRLFSTIHREEGNLLEAHLPWLHFPSISISDETEKSNSFSRLLINI